MAFQFDQRYPLGVTSDQYHTLVYQQIPVYIPRKKFYVADIFIYHVQQKLEDNMPILGQCFTMVNNIMFFFSPYVTSLNLTSTLRGKTE